MSRRPEPETGNETATSAVGRIIEGDVHTGLGLARKIGFPTVNITNERRIWPGIYVIEHDDHGRGCAIVLEAYCEVHFFEDIEAPGSRLSCRVVESLLDDVPDPPAGTILHMLQRGLEREQARWLIRFWGIHPTSD